MKFARCTEHRGEKTPAVLSDGSCFDISSVVADPGSATTSDLGEIVEAVKRHRDLPLDLESERLGSPLARPYKLNAVGLNYADDVAEAGAEMPTEPVPFMKSTSSVCGPNDDIPFPPGASKMDWEIELAVVVGKECRNLRDENAGADAIAGYMIGNDISERAFQLERGGQWLKGKSADNFAALGPWMVTADEVSDPCNLDMVLTVNGETRQQASTSTMIFSPAHCVAYISRFMTLEPGDVVLTGTPPGVGMASGDYLKPGDVVELEITGPGRQRQQFVGESTK